jgi:hypothetical protein
MRETARARQAWLDYLAMGPQRSLEKLLSRYQTGTTLAPVRNLTRLKQWSATFNWQGRLAEIQAKEQAAIEAASIVHQTNRISMLDRLHRGLERIVDERAASPAMKDVPGGSTGLLVGEPVIVKVYGSDGKEDTDDEILTPVKEARILRKYAIDKTLVSLAMALEKQVVQEKGEWSKKSEQAEKGKGRFEEARLQIKASLDESLGGLAQGEPALADSLPPEGDNGDGL